MKPLTNRFERFWTSELRNRIESKKESNWRAHSPFRPDFNASFSVNIENGLWNDFGADDLSGNILQFVQKRHRLSKTEAEEYLEGKFDKNELLEIEFLSNHHHNTSISETNFQYLELVENGIKNRRNLKRIKKQIVLPEYKGNKLFKDCHHTVFHHNVGLYNYAKHNNGEIKGYKGSCYARQIPIDIDADYLNEARDVALEVYLKLTRYGYSRREIKVAFSGRRGFHLYIPGYDLTEFQGRNNTPKLIEDYIDKLFPDIEQVDRKIYQHVHIIRSLNSWHPKGGFFKIPLSQKELFQKSIRSIKSLAKTQRCLKKVWGA